MKLSIIIPVYNVEGYIGKCLESCITQDIPSSDYEIVIINDGSTDNSGSIAKEFASNNKNVRYLEKKNGGLGSARNAGIKASKGMYLWFVDSDDCITKDSVKLILNICDNFKSEIIAIDSILDNDGEQVRKSRLLEKSGFYNARIVYEKGFLYPYSGAPFYIVKKSFLEENNISFVEGLYYEDMLYTPVLLSHATMCYYLKDFLYVYYVRGGSITQSKITLQKCEHQLLITDEIYNNLKKVASREGRFILKSSLFKMLSSYYHYYFSALENKEDRVSARKLFVERKYLPLMAIRSFKIKAIIRCIQMYFKL